MSRPHSGTDLNDFYDAGSIPPPHRLSNLYQQSPVSSQTNLYNSSSPSLHLQSYPQPAPLSSAQDKGFQPVPTNDLAHDENPFYMPAAQFGSNGSQAHEYQNMENSQWLEKQEKSNSRAKWIVGGSILGLLVLIGVGVGVGVGVSQANKSSSNDSTSSNSSSSSSDDPSSFTKDPALIQSFYGIAYTPEGSQLPDCGNNLSSVITDIQLLSQLTTRIRLYGADCNQSALVLDAIQQTKVNMTVWLGNYNVPTDGGVAYARQKDEIQSVLETFGTDNIGGITVGNEWILNYLDAEDATSSETNGDIGNAGAALLIVNITDTKEMLTEMSIDLPVGSADAGSYINNLVLEAVDYGMANVHPWFADTTIDDAAPWTFEFFDDTDIIAAQNVSNTPDMYIAETGWPTASNDTATATNGAAEASVANLQIFLDDFVCQANANNTMYFFFEAFDEAWKEDTYGGVEGYWGLFNGNKTLKDGLTIPDCSS